jgi:hypothetical protein
MSIEEFTDDTTQVYTHKNRAYVSCIYQPELVTSLNKMQKRWWSPKLREWSFAEESLDEFLTNNKARVLQHNVIIYMMHDEVCFKMLDEQDIVCLLAIEGITYDPSNRVYSIPLESYPELEKYIEDNGLKGVKRTLPARIQIKRPVKKVVDPKVSEPAKI